MVFVIYLEMVSFQAPTKEAEDDAFSIAVLPDTQKYSQEDPEIFESQTQWIADVAETEKIQFVTHVGDIVHQTTEDQLTNADDAMRTLDENEIPYGISIGNHDYDKDGLVERKATEFDTYFGPERFEKASWWEGTYDESTMHNAYARFSYSGRDFMVLFLELFPRAEVVEWATEVLSRYADHETILVTHGYLWHDSTRIDEENRWDATHYNISDGINGPEIWEQIVKPNDNIFLVLSGHVLCDGSARLTSVRDDGSVVHQLLSNYQDTENGGNGYLRLLRLHPGKDRISVETYSPSLEQRHPATSHHFVLEYPFDE